MDDCRDLPSIIIDGKYFIRDGKRFNIRGVVYQSCDRDPPFAKFNPDPLRSECLEDLLEDIKLFLELGINTIYVYTLLPDESHDAAFRALAAAGIYVVLGIGSPYHCINRHSPHESYTEDLLRYFFTVVDMASRYSNVLGLTATNSLINNPGATVAAEVARAVIRDVKAYMQRRTAQTGQRVLPIGISDDSFAASTTDSIDYFSAGNPNECIDFYAFITYDPVETPATYWDNMSKQFEGRSLPIFVSEYGYAANRPREFFEAVTLYQLEASQVISGGFVYQFIEGPNQFGLIKNDGERLQDFINYKMRLSQSYSDIADGLPGRNIEQRQIEFPVVSSQWRASSNLPTTPLTLTEES